MYAYGTPVQANKGRVSVRGHRSITALLLFGLFVRVCKFYWGYALFRGDTGSVSMGLAMRWGGWLIGWCTSLYRYCKEEIKEKKRPCESETEERIGFL